MRTPSTLVDCGSLLPLPYVPEAATSSRRHFFSLSFPRPAYFSDAYAPLSRFYLREKRAPTYGGRAARKIYELFPLRFSRRSPPAQNSFGYIVSFTYGQLGEKKHERSLYRELRSAPRIRCESPQLKSPGNEKNEKSPSGARESNNKNHAPRGLIRAD